MAMFEAPISHEAVHYSYPESQYSAQEMEEEFSAYGTPEAEYEGVLDNIVRGLSGRLGEEESSHEYREYGSRGYSTPRSPRASSTSEAEYEELLGDIVRGLSGRLGEEESSHEYHEYQDEASAYSTPEAEYEGLFREGESGYEAHEYEEKFGGYAGHSEYEADMFSSKQVKGFFSKIAKIAAPIAKKLAPIVAGALADMIPGVGAVAGPLAGQLTATLLKQSEMEVAEMEDHFLHTLASTSEAEHPEVHEALLAEILAAHAAGAHAESEAEAAAGAIVPLMMRTMKAQRSVLPVAPALVQSNVRLVKTLRGQGAVGKEILRLLPEINALATSLLKGAAHLQQLTSPLAVRAMALAANRVLGDPHRVQRGLKRNIAVGVAQADHPRGRLPLRQVPRRRGVSV